MTVEDRSESCANAKLAYQDEKREYALTLVVKSVSKNENAS